MEVIKTSPNVEFDVIYADGMRLRVKEGILYEAEGSGDLIFHNGTDRVPVLLAAAECMLVSLFGIGPGLEALVLGMSLTEEPRAALEHLVDYAREILGSDKARQQAIFRLGQMDMRESAAAKLRSAAVNAYGIVRATLESAADLIDEMETLDSETGQEVMNAEN